MRYSLEREWPCDNKVDVASMSEQIEKIDILHYLSFIWKNRVIYFVSMVLCLSLSAAYCFYGTEQIYECRAVLYYPVAGSSEAESGGRALMDDAVMIVQQEKMLQCVEHETGIAWKEIQRGLSITGNSETGMIEISCKQSDSTAAYNSTKGVVELFGTQLKEIIPIEDVVVLEKPEKPDKPIDKGCGKVMAAGTACGLAAGSIVSVWKKRYRQTILEL